MGNDGGSIPDRRDLVKSKPKAEQADKANQVRARWGFCALSKKPLQEPVVSCALGRLYNKDAIIEFLLDRNVYGDGDDICGHVKSLKDVKTLTLTPNPVKASSSDDVDIPPAAFVCPLTMKEMNGAVPFLYITTCGCVFSQAGLKAVLGPSPQAKADGQEPGTREKDLCPQCTKKFDRVEDLCTINPGPEEEEIMMEKLAAARASKAKSGKKRKAAVAEIFDTKDKKRERVVAPSTNPSIAASSRIVVEGLAEEEKKRLAHMSDAVKSLYQGKSTKADSNWISRGTFTRYA
ncbi:DUF602-domain-containing protein [Sistotremastrum niveocremeum HHB9708]|uniref:DUF602-domain-containing protein n=1 Tax=Sistotremastrum niveocremeum HHB9708 TaxID=1314777 RepID=A0A164R409_9AGAM|nr:DUF602-domain-containing protein [Sistotremastrum niveocremeum HHB9708]